MSKQNKQKMRQFERSKNCFGLDDYSSDEIQRTNENKKKIRIKNPTISKLYRMTSDYIVYVEKKNKKRKAKAQKI